MTKSAEEIPDIKAKEFFENLFCMDFLTEEERQTIYDAAELYAKGRIRFEQSQPKEQPEWDWETKKHPLHGTWAVMHRKDGFTTDFDLYYATSQPAADRLKSLLNASEGDSVEICNVINLAQAELRAMYKRVGVKGSNVLDLLDQKLEKL